MCAFREEWDWIQTLVAIGEKNRRSEEDEEEAEPQPESHAPLLYYELQVAIKSLLKHINVSLHQVCSPAQPPFEPDRFTQQQRLLGVTPVHSIWKG